MASQGGFQRPKVGVSVIIKHPKSPLHSRPVFLLGLRRGAHGAGTWGLPGGHLEYGESFEECAARESKEETGFELKNIRFLTATNDVFNGVDLGKHYITIFVTADVDLSGLEVSQNEELKAEIREPEKCEAWEWFSWEQVKGWISKMDSDTAADASHTPFLPLISLAEQRPELHPLEA